MAIFHHSYSTFANKLQITHDNRLHSPECWLNKQDAENLHSKARIYSKSFTHRSNKTPLICLGVTKVMKAKTKMQGGRGFLFIFLWKGSTFMPKMSSSCSQYFCLILCTLPREHVWVSVHSQCTECKCWGVHRLNALIIAWSLLVQW